MEMPQLKEDQTCKASCEQEKENTEESTIPDSPGTRADMLLVDSMLNHLAKSQQAPFKSQQVGEPDLNFSEKKDIAKNILKENPVRFLEKFGHYLLEDHLDYFSFSDNPDKNYEIDFHIKLLRRFHCKSKNHVDVRNRRYEALKKLIHQGEYFSEEAMKKRNPLLYEQLIGRYLTPKEREDRCEEANKRQSRSYVVHLMEQIENHYVNCLRKQQRDDEAAEEMDTSDEEEICVNDVSDTRSEDENQESDNIEEFDSSDESDAETKQINKEVCRVTPHCRRVSDEEKDLLREEFANNMYESFLEGKDTEFDYTTIDTNPEYECLAVRAQDEEEQYFDSETPELVKSGNVTPALDENEEEDELDKYMKNLNS